MLCVVLCVVYKVVSPAAAWCEAAVSADDRTRVSTQTPSMSIYNEFSNDNGDFSDNILYNDAINTIISGHY